MNILVCIKQVPQSESATVILPDGSWISRGGHVEYKMNRFDEYAVEEALRIKDQEQGVHVDVITLGPDRARDVVKRALGMGADDGCHLIHDKASYLDPGVVASLLSSEARNVAYDLILTGIMSEDMMQAQTGQMMAARLNWPCVTSVIGLSVDREHHRLEVIREIEGGVKSRMSVTLPCVITVQAGINVPRYPSLSRILKANTKEINTIAVAPEQGTLRCEAVGYPEKKREGRILTGSREEQARELITLLRHKNILR